MFFINIEFSVIQLDRSQETTPSIDRIKTVVIISCFMCLYILFFNGHMVHPYNHFLGYQVLVMDVSCVYIYCFFKDTCCSLLIIPLGDNAFNMLVSCISFSCATMAAELGITLNIANKR